MSILGQAGIKGLPFVGLIALAWKQMTGRTMENDLREQMQEAGIPDKAIDLSLHGAYSSIGVDASSLIGVGDLISTQGNEIVQLFGAPAGFAEQISRAAFFAQNGDYKRALETASPDAIRNVLKGLRYSSEGVRKFSGELITKPSQTDAILQSLGLTPLSVSKAYQAEEAKRVESQSKRERDMLTNQKIAKALEAGDRKMVRRIMDEVRAHNSKVSLDQRITISLESIRNNILKSKGIESNDPRILRKRFREIDKRFDVKK